MKTLFMLILLTLGSTIAQAQDEAPLTLRTNVGVVVYTPSKSHGTFDSKWSHSTNGSGTGRLIGGPIKGIAGNYKAVYFDEQGREKFSLDLIIENQGDHYALTYKMDGETICIGLGNEVSGNLVAGYSFVHEKWLVRP